MAVEIKTFLVVPNICSTTLQNIMNYYLSSCLGFQIHEAPRSQMNTNTFISALPYQLASSFYLQPPKLFIPQVFYLTFWLTFRDEQK